MSSRSRSAHKIPSKHSKHSDESKSTERSKTKFDKKHPERSGRSLSSSLSKTGSHTSSKKRPRSAASGKRTKSIVSKKRSKEDSLDSQKQPSQKKIVKVQNDPCGCGPDFYTNVLGPTADETILVGLQTFMKFCQECPDNYLENTLVDSGTGLSTKDSTDVSENSVKEEEEILVTDVSEKDNSLKDLSVKSVSIKEFPEIENKDNTNHESKTSEIKKESAKELPPIEDKKESLVQSHISQPIQEPKQEPIQEPKQEVEVHSTPEPSIHTEEVIVHPEDHSDTITEELPKSVPTEPSMSKHSSQSMELQTTDPSSSQESQTEQPRVRSDISQTGSKVEVGSSQTSELSLSNAESQTLEPEVKSSSSQAKYRSNSSQKLGKPGSTDKQVFYTHRTDKFEPFAGNRSEQCCPCGDTTSSSGPRDKSTSCSCSSCKMKSSQKSMNRRSCLKPVTKCRCGNTLTAATSRSSFSPTSQKRRVRVCCDCSPSPSICVSVCDNDNTENAETQQMGDTNEGCVKIRYAITKITKFYSYTTFEIMRSTRKKPKVMPTLLEGVFVIKNAPAKASTTAVS